MWSAKVVYLLFNEIGPADIEIILSQLGIVEKHSIKYAMLSKQLWGEQSRWQYQIMTGFIMKIVGRLIVEWEEDNPGGDIRNISIDARSRFWEAEYKTDPIGVAQSMWALMKSVVDWHAIFKIDIDELSAESTVADYIDQIVTEVIHSS
jgi:hypothetical protein